MRMQSLNTSKSIGFSANSSRAGLSLLEVMIVLVIMVGVTALVWPNLQKKLQRTSLTESAALVRELLHQTRYRANENGQSYVVRLETGSNELSVATVDEFLSGPDFRQGHHSAKDSNRDFSLPLSSSDSPKLTVLPTSVVISDVQWATHPSEFEISSRTTDMEANRNSTDAKPQESNPPATTQPESEAESIPVHAYCLPILAGTSQGRDVTITLTDKVAHESIDVSFCAATGIVEVSP